MRALNRPWLLSWLLLFGACEGTSTGNPTQDPPLGGGPGRGEETSGGNCKETSSTELAPDQPTALGFAASDVLAFVEGTHEERLTWHPDSFADYGPETGEHGLTLTVTRKGAPRLTKYMVDGSRGEIALPGGNCSDAIEIDVEVVVRTDEGALNETFETTIVARHAMAVSLYLLLKPDQLDGSFAVTNIHTPGFQLAQLNLSIELTKYGNQGSLRATYERRESGGVSSGAAGRLPLASFGPEDCDYRGSAVPNTAAPNGFSAEDVLALLNRTSSASIGFEGSAPSTGTLSFSAASERACAVLDDGFATFGGAGSLHVQATLRIMSDRLDASWPVGITVTPQANGGIEKAQIVFDDERLAQDGSFEARYGIRGIDVSPYDSATARLTLAATPSSPVDGQLEVTGYKNAQCTPVVTIDPDGEGTSGCMGATPTLLARARITAAAQ